MKVQSAKCRVQSGAEPEGRGSAPPALQPAAAKGDGKPPVDPRDVTSIAIDVPPAEAAAAIAAGAEPGVIVPGGPEVAARVDQFKCPKCGKFGCPCQRGKTRTRHGWVRTRRCTACSTTFGTFEQWAPGSVTVGCGEETVKS